ncbi:MAG: hypothetical protein WBA77_18570 [Microcoleaceae cyanobacterium]
MGLIKYRQKANSSTPERGAIRLYRRRDGIAPSREQGWSACISY